MGFFSTLLINRHLTKHDGRPLWKYSLTDQEFENLVSEINYASTHTIDARDACLYYAEWWKRNYNGGKPSKEEIFKSLNGNINYRLSSGDFFKLAKRGAYMLGVKWVSKQYTLYFQTLLLQGGLPLRHVSENQGKYQNFLLAVLEEQPDTIEDFIFKPHVINYLPVSSQNNIIYENCFEIVKSILNEEDTYDDLLTSNEAIENISGELKVRKTQLQRRQRLSKPKNYWLLSFDENKIFISLRIGFADKYTAESLGGILGFEVHEREYQFYLNDELICAFRKMLNGNYKTEWYLQQDHVWNGESDLPYAYVLVQGKTHEVNDFIQIVPNLHEPSLWSNYSDSEWRLMKGNGTSNKEAAVLFPTQWSSNLSTEKFFIHDNTLNWLPFEGEIEIQSQEEHQKFLSEVNSFDWTIVSQKPSWMLKASLPVVQRKPTILVYDENNRKVPASQYKISFKSHNKPDDWWQDLSEESYFPLGCIDLKIEKDNLVAWDMCFNLGNLQVIHGFKSIDRAEISVEHLNQLNFQLEESPLLSIDKNGANYICLVETKFRKVPTGIKGSVGMRHQKKLFFTLVSPFEGMVIIDKEGNIVSEDQQLSLRNLYGLRILSTPGSDTTLTMKNTIKPDVKILKRISEPSHPVISFRNEIVRVYYLADAMKFGNIVSLELREGHNSSIYKISGFTHTLDIEERFNHQVSLFNSDDELDLYAIPVNCTAADIDLIPLVRKGSFYLIPSIEELNQFVIISTKEKDQQLMPRFVNIDKNYIGEEKEERISSYHDRLLGTEFNSKIWQQVLAYFNICVEHELPFSTFDQLRAISKSSRSAARAFFYLGINQVEPDNFVQKIIPEMELDLGFCFHWIKKEDWVEALHEISELHQHRYFLQISQLLSSYMKENKLDDITCFINGDEVTTEGVNHTEILNLRAGLGHRVLNELPIHKPSITQTYTIPIQHHEEVKLLLHSPIAVAESISDVQQDKPIWGGDEFRDTIRRNIQYSQYLNPEFYTRTLLHALRKR